MKLSVGLINTPLYWEELINQAGVSSEKIKVIHSSLNDFPVLILNEQLNYEQKNIINNYLINGGSIILEAGFAELFFNITCKRKKIDYFYSINDKIFSSLYAEINNVLRVPVNANYLQSEDGSNNILIEKSGKGEIVVVPDNLLPLIFSNRAARKIFYSEWGKEFPTEKVSAVDKNSIYRIAYKIFEYLFHKKDLPFIRLWHLPDGNTSIFGFRVDTDFAKDEDIKELGDTISKNNIQATWFVETFSRKDNLDLFKKFTRQEIALHCYRHKSYKDVKNNLDDIRRGIRILNGSNFNPSGYASPFGEWNDSIGKAIEKSAFVYSSEFGFIYDSLPVHPFVEGKKTESLQIPIHPVSVGRLNIAGLSEDEMIKYYTNIVMLKRKSFDPVIFYTHPSQKRFNVFRKIFELINYYGIPSILFKDYAVWWKRREEIKWEPEIIDNKIKTKPAEKYDSFFIHLSFNDGRNYLSSVNSEDLLSGKQIQPYKYDYPEGFHPDLLRKNTLGILKQEIIYNYRKLKH